MGLIPGLERSSGGGNGYPLQYSCLKNPMDRGAWRAMVQRVTKNQTQLSNYLRRHTVSPYVSIITFNVDGLSFPIKRHGMTKWIFFFPNKGTSTHCLQ